MVLLDAAGLVAALAATPVHTAEQGKVAFVPTNSKNAESALQFNWPNLQGEHGGNRIPPLYRATYDSYSWYTGDKSSYRTTWLNLPIGCLLNRHHIDIRVKLA
jgi:hypothetical protein